MAVTAARLAVEVGADTREAERGLDRVGDKIQGAGRTMQRAGDRMVGMGKTMSRAVTLPIIAVGAAIVSTGMRFETEMSRITGLVGASEQQMGEYKAAIMAMSPDVARPPQELAEALFFVTSAGFEGQEALDVLEASARAAAGGLGETKTIADAVTSAINAFGPENLNAAQATDVLTAAVREGKLEAETIAPVLGRLMPIAAELGVTFDETAGFIAAMSRTGLDANMSASALRGVMAKLVKPTQQARDVLEEYGLSAEGLRQQVREEGLLATLQTLEATFGDNQEAMGLVFEDVEALTGVLNVLGQDSETVAEIMGGVSDSAGAVDDAFAAAEQTMRHQFNAAMAEAQVFLIELAAVVMPMVASALERVTGWLRSAAEWWGNLSPQAQQTIVILAGVTAAIGPLLIALGLLIKMVGLMVVGFGVILSPITLVVLGLAALGAALVIAYKRSETFRNIVNAAFEAVKSAVTSALQVVQKVVTTVLTAVQRFWDRWGDNIMNVVRAVMDYVVNTIRNVFNVIQGIWRVVTGLLTGDWDRFWQGIGQIAGALMNQVRNIVDTGLTFVRNLFPIAASAITAAWRSMWTSVKNAAASMLASIVSTVRGKIDEVIAFFRGLPARIRGAISNPGEILRSIGRQIIDGLIGGITGMVGKAVSAVKDAVGGVVRGARSALGISSPSRVFEQVGIDTLQGMVRGIEASRTDLLKTMSGVIDDVMIRPTVDLGARTSPPAGSSTTVENHYHLHSDNHVDRPMDERRLAEQLRRMELLHAR